MTRREFVNRRRGGLPAVSGAGATAGHAVRPSTKIIWMSLLKSAQKRFH
jgi:hypothetical protein